MIGRKRQNEAEEQRAALLRQRPADLPPRVRVREPLTVQGVSLEPGMVFGLRDETVQAIIAELADPHRFFEVVT